MSLSAGVRLGPDEILAFIGVGGTGEVYRATESAFDGRQTESEAPNCRPPNADSISLPC